MSDQPTKLGPWLRPPLADPKAWRRFESKVVRTSGCWVWTGAISDGYGLFHDAAYAVGGRWPTVRVSRWIWSAYNGPLRSWQVVLHECDTPLCVRYEPERQHLSAGTQLQNIRMAAGRDRMTNLGRLGRADARGPHGQSLAIRAAMLAAVADGITDPDQLAGILATVIAAGDPQHPGQQTLF